jgi:hypothetical protein
MDDVTARIAGAEKLVAVFGDWPVFHDAEVVWLKLDRRPHGDGSGPTLEALVHGWEMTDEVGPEGHYVLRHRVLVHLRFREVVDLRLEDFNIQNVLFALRIADVQEPQAAAARFDVRFQSTFGVDASFQCRGVEVVAVTPCTNDGEPISAGP